jgi:hypothetical protein
VDSGDRRGIGEYAGWRMWGGSEQTRVRNRAATWILPNDPALL